MAVQRYLKEKDPEIKKYFSKCFVCGDDNPDGLHLVNTFQDGRSHVEGRPGPAQMGLCTGGDNGLMHGGFSMMMMDEAFYYVCKAGLGLDVVTIYLNTNFTSPAILGHKLAAEAWLTDRQGKKIFMEGHIIDMDNDNKVVVHADAMYMAVDLESFLKTSEN